jgi:hypothetical protein
VVRNASSRRTPARGRFRDDSLQPGLGRVRHILGNHRPKLESACWGIPSVLIGLYMIAGRFFADSYQRARTYYGVTGQRVIIVNGLWGRDVKSLALQSLGEISLNERTDKSGSITFGPTTPAYSIWSGTPWPGMNKKLSPSFDLVDDVRQVYDLIREAQESLASRALGS